MTVHNEAEAVRQAKEYLDIDFVVNAIKRPDGSIAHDQDQLSALYHGFDDLALQLAEKRMPRNRGEATEATQPRDTPATELIPEEPVRPPCLVFGIGIPRINRNRFADLQDFENSRPINFRFVPT